MAYGAHPPQNPGATEVSGRPVGAGKKRRVDERLKEHVLKEGKIHYGG